MPKAVLANDDSAKFDRLRRAFKSDGWDLWAKDFTLHRDVIRALLEVIEADSSWMVFDILVLDVHWGPAAPWGGFDIYAELTRYFNAQVKSRNRPALPWRDVVFASFYAGHPDGNPDRTEAERRLTQLGVPRDRLIQMVTYDDAKHVVTKCRELIGASK